MSDWKRCDICGYWFNPDNARDSGKVEVHGHYLGDACNGCKDAIMPEGGSYG